MLSKLIDSGILDVIVAFSVYDKYTVCGLIFVLFGHLQASGEAQPPRQTNVLDLKRAPPAGFGGKRRPGGTAPALDLGGGVSVGPDGTRRDNSQVCMLKGVRYISQGNSA